MLKITKIFKNYKRRKVYSSFKDNIWGVGFADMQLRSKYNKGIRYLLCVIDLFSRYSWVIPLKNKEGESIVEGFKKILDDSNRKPNKIWVDHGSEFYNNKFKSFLKKNYIEMYSTSNEGKSVVAERFIKTLENKIYKHMTTIGKNVYFNVLDDIVDKYNNSFHSSIKMKPKDVNDDSFGEYNEETNKKSPKFKGGDNVRISKYKNIFAKGYKKLKTNCTIPDKTFVLSVHCNATDDNSVSFLFINGAEQYKFKTDKNEIVARKLNLGSISDNSVLLYNHTMNGNIYSFALDYELTKTGKIQKIHKYLMKNTTYKMSYVATYLSESSSITHVIVDLELEGVATKKDLESITHVDTSGFALKTNLSALKTEVDKLDIRKLGTIPTDVAKITNKVANDIVEKTDLNSLKTKVNENEADNDNLESKVTSNHLITETSINNLKTKVDGIDLTKYVKKSDYDTKVGNLELKIPDVNGKLNTSDFNSKVSEKKPAEQKPNISNLARISSVTAVLNKIPDVSGFVKKSAYATEISSTKMIM